MQDRSAAPYLAGSALLALLILGGAYWSYQSRTTLRAALSDAQTSIRTLEEQLAAAEAENENLRSLLQQAAAENEAFGERVAALTENVNLLDKLSKTDRELLQKYSSVYFLSENFVPDTLAPIDTELLARPESNAMLRSEVFPFLKRMMQAAKADGAPLLVLSAYRSFGEQSTLKSSYKITYGAGTANQFSADQGYSEHQLGTTVDFSTPEEPENLTTAFRKTPQYRWLTLHAHEYGFTLSYPEGNAYFEFEPWHWRFVGVELATRLYYENKYFYDLDQRDINPYLARIFD